MGSIITSKEPTPGETLLDRGPSDLEETAPFSLLNALLADAETAPRYEPPALQPRSQGEPESKQRLTDPPPEPPAEAPTDEVSVEGTSTEVAETKDPREPAPTVPEAEHKKESTATEAPEAPEEPKKEEEPASPSVPWPSSAKLKFGSTVFPSQPPAPRPKRKVPGTPTAPPVTPSPPPTSTFQTKPSGGVAPRAPKSFDPIDKAIRIFEALDSKPARKAPEATPAPESESVPDTKTPPVAKPQADLPSPVEPPPASAPSPPPSLDRPVQVRRRRRRRVPINPWTSQGSLPQETSPDAKKKHIQDALASLAEMLEQTLDSTQAETVSPAPSAEVAPEQPAGIASTPHPNQVQEAAPPVDEKPPALENAPVTSKPVQPLTPPEPPAPPVSTPAESTPPEPAPAPEAGILNQSFATTPPPNKRVKVKLVPRALRDEEDAGTDADSNGESATMPDFEITAPTAIVSEDTPISPFTKVVRGEVKEPQDAASPFRLASPATARVSGNLPTAPPAAKGPSHFASPFSTALQKRDAQAQQAGGTPSPRVAPIQPPANDPSAEAEIAAGHLPEPTYSFSSMGVPAAQRRQAPSAPPPTQQSSLHRVPPAPTQQHPQLAPTPAPNPSTSTPVPTTPPEPVIKAPREDGVRRVKKRRPAPEQGSWRFLTGIITLIAIGFLLLWIHEFSESFSREGTPADEEVISPDAEDPGVATPEIRSLSPDATETPAVPLSTPSAVDLSSPLECVSGFIAADPQTRPLYVVEGASVRDAMQTHYEIFPLQGILARQIIGDGTFPDSGRSYMNVEITWDDETKSQVRLIRSERGDYRFSWHAFEQSRRQLLRQYHETQWTGWTRFFVRIKPIGADQLPEETVLEHLWFRVTVPEDPEFEALAYVDENASIISGFRERFPNQTNYEVLIDLLRNESLPSDERPVFRITGLVESSWDASQ